MINDRAKGRKSWLGAAGGDTADAKSDSGTRASDLMASHASWDQVFGGLSETLRPAHLVTWQPSVPRTLH